MDRADRDRITARDIARLSQERRAAAAALRGQVYADLQQTFAHHLKEQFDRTPAEDPVLSALFLAIADQLAPVYEAAENHLPAALLDDLLRGLDGSPRLASPAQTVIQFIGHHVRERIGRSLQLLGLTRTGHYIRFCPDHPVVISRAQLVFAAILEPSDGTAPARLMTLNGPQLPSGAQLEVAQTRLTSGARSPAVYLAFRMEPGEDLSGLGLFVDTTTPFSPIARVLRRSPWQLLADHRGHTGVALRRGLLRLAQDDGTLSRLEWLQRPAETVSAEADELDALPVFRGNYGPQVFLFPDVPPDRRLMSSIPEYIESAVRELLPPFDKTALDQPCVWIRIPLPPNLPGISIRRIIPHCVTASNLEVWTSEHVVFRDMGPAQSFLPEGNAERHIAGVLSVIGESGAAYVDATLLSGGQGSGTYRVRSPLLEFEPLDSGIRPDSYARVRLVLTDGANGNGLEGDQRPFTIESAITQPGVQIQNLTDSRDGRDPPDALIARRDFASRLRTRARAVTAQDVDALSRAFDARIIAARAEPAVLEYAAGGTRPVVPVSLQVDVAHFEDPATQLPLLAAHLEEHLHERAPIGMRFRVRAAP